MLSHGIDHQSPTGNSLDLICTKVFFYPLHRADTIVEIKNAVKKVLVKLHKICKIHGSTMQESHLPSPFVLFIFLILFSLFRLCGFGLAFQESIYPFIEILNAYPDLCGRFLIGRVILLIERSKEYLQSDIAYK